MSGMHPENRRGSVNDSSPLKKARCSSPNEGAIRRHLWESPRGSPRLNNTKCSSSHCHHAYRNKALYSTDDDSEVNSSYPSSPMKRYLVTQPYSQPADEATSLTASLQQYHSEDWTDETSNASTLEINLVKVTSDNESIIHLSETDGYNSSGRHSKEPNKITSHYNLKSKPSSTSKKSSAKNRNSSRHNNGGDTNLNTHNSKVKAPVPAHHTDEGIAKPKVKKNKVMGGITNIGNYLTDKVSSTGKGLNKKANSGITSKESNAKNITRHVSNVGKSSFNSGSTASKNRMIFGNTNKSPLWTKNKQNPSIVIENCSKNDSTNKTIMSNNPSAVKYNRDNRQWSNIGKGIVGNQSSRSYSNSSWDSYQTLHGSCSSLSVGRNSSRRNSLQSLPGSRCSSRNDQNFLYVDSSRSSSSLSNISSNVNFQDHKTDVSDYSPVRGSNVWNPYWNSKLIVTPKDRCRKNFRSGRSNYGKRRRNNHDTPQNMVGNLKGNCSGYHTTDYADEHTDDNIGDLTLDNIRNTESIRNESGYNKSAEGSRENISSLNNDRNSTGSSFERDSAIGSMNSLIRRRNSFDRDPLSNSVKSLDNWDIPKVNSNSGSCNGSFRSLDDLQSKSYGHKKVTAKMGTRSLNDISDNVRDNKYRESLRCSNFSLNDRSKYLEVSDTSFNVSKGLQSSSSGCIVREHSGENLSKGPLWSSFPKLNQGWESIGKCIVDKTNRWQPKQNCRFLTNKDLAERKLFHGWNSITHKVMEKDWKKEAQKAVDNFRLGGGEDESEWVNTKEEEEERELRESGDTLHVETQRSQSLTNGRAPKFSEVFGAGDGLKGMQSQVLYGSQDDTTYKAERSSKSVGISSTKQHKGRDCKKDDGIECERNLQTAIHRSLRNGPHSETEDEQSHQEGHESGLGSSFDGSSDSSLNIHTPQKTPSHPQNFYAAITNYLRNVDQNDSEEDVDNFNKEADVFDPEDLILLTDNEDNLTWKDLIIYYNMSPVHVDKHRDVEVKDAYNDIQPDFLSLMRGSISDRKLEQELGQLLANEFGYDWHNMTDQEDFQGIKRNSGLVKSDEKEPVGSDPNKLIENESLWLQCAIHKSEDEKNRLTEKTVDADQKEGTKVTSPSDVVVSTTKRCHCECEVLWATLEDKESVELASASRETTEVITQTQSKETKEAEAQTDNVVVESPRSRSQTKEDQTSSESTERGVRCSENIRAFLLSQPCALAHIIRGTGGLVKRECRDKHTYSKADVSIQLEVAAAAAACQQEKAKPKKKKKKAKTSEKKPEEKKSTSKRVIQSFFNMFCTTPVTVEGIAPDAESHDTDPEPLPPPIPPHAVDPEVMTADEAQRLLSAKESQGLLSDEEAQEVVLLLSPPEEETTSKIPPPPPVPPHHGDDLPSVPPHYDIPPAVPPHYTDIAPPVPPHYGPSEDEFDTRVASHFDASLASPLSPEDEPSEADSSEASGDVCQVSRVKEVLVEDGVHYLEDGHFWVEVPGLPEDDDEEDNDPMLPFHPHTKLSFSKNPIQVFSTYSVTEYDRKNDEVDPVAASAEYELEKRVEKMDLFPVEIIKGEGGLGLSIIGMGVGADAGVEKLGIFVKTITCGGATEGDGRIQVNDQIIEVDGKSLVGVTQVFAASVLKNTSGRVHFLIGREKDPENSEVALLIKQSLQADREREERRRALGGPDYDPRTGHGLFDALSSPEENSRSEEASHPQNYSSYLEGGSSPTSPDAVSPPIESFDLEGDTSDTSPDNDVSVLKLKLKELLEMEKIVTENTQYTSQLNDAHIKVAELDDKLQSKLSEVSTYQDMLEQSQGQYIILEKKYYKAKKIIKEYQGRERDFLHREEYHITQLEEKDSHYNALVKALKDRVINLEEELTNAQKKAGLPVEVPYDPSVQPAYLDLQQSTQAALAKVPVKEELDEAVPPHELLDVSASRAKGELAARGGLANRHLPSLKKTTSMSSAGSQEHSLDDSSLDDELPEAQKHTAVESIQDNQQEQGSWREVHSDASQRNDREASPSKRSPTSLMEDVRQAVLQADVSSHVVSTGQMAQQINSPNRSQQSGFYSPAGRDSLRETSAGSQSPKLGRSSIHASPMSGVSANPSGVVLLSQRPIDSSLPAQKMGPGVDGSSGDLSSGPASLGSGDEGSGASLGSQTSLSHSHPPSDRSKRPHMWQSAPVIDWTKEQVSQWLVVQGLESCVSRFQEIGMTGPRLLNLDVRDLKSLGIPLDEKSKLKRKVKDLRLAVEKERKQAEKEKKERERLQKKAEKLAEKAERKKK